MVLLSAERDIDVNEIVIWMPGGTVVVTGVFHGFPLFSMLSHSNLPKYLA